MRARYYNPDIKRFINQDILTGSIGESPSLNRYSYVQGNPVSYLDPFGLSIFDFDLKRAAHAVLDIIGCVPGGIGMGADLLNSLLYLAEGETGEALKSLVFAFVPGGVGALANYGVKAGKLSEKALTALTYVQASMNTAGTIIGAEATGNAIAFMIDKYLVQGAEVTSDTLIECMEIAAGGLQASTSAKGLSDSLPKGSVTETAIEQVNLGNENDIQNSFANMMSPEEAVRYEGYWKWKEVEGTPGFEGGTAYDGWYNADGTINYPPNNGAIPGTQTIITLGENNVVSVGRNGTPKPNSVYVTQSGASATSLSLPPNTDPSTYINYKIIKPIVNVEQATIIPWAGDAGLGIQYKLPNPIKWYIDNEYLLQE